MRTILVHWRALGTFIQLLPRMIREVGQVYRNQAQMARSEAIVVRELRDGVAPEKLARLACEQQGLPVDHPHYKELLAHALEIKARFHV